MRESELGSLMAKALRKSGATVFKLHNDGMQRGLPDYILWARGSRVVALELKVARSLAEALAGLSPGQESVLRSLALTSSGAVIAYGDRDSDGYVVGAGKLTGDWAKQIEAIVEAPHDLSRRASTMAEAGRLLAAEVMLWVS